MKSKILIRILISLAIVLLTANFPATAFAEDTLKWTISKDRAELCFGDETFYRHDVPHGYRKGIWNSNVLQTSSAFGIKVSADPGCTVFYAGDDYECYYTDDQTQAKLEYYFSGVSGTTYLTSKDLHAGAKYEKLQRLYDL